MAAILKGADGFTAADYFESAALNALPGDPSGFAISVLCKVNTQVVDARARRIFASRGGANPGWEINTGTTNSFFQFALGGVNAGGAPTLSIGAGDVGKLFMLTGVWDGPQARVRLYRRVEIGTGSALAGGYQTETGYRTMIGRKGVGNPCDSITVYGVYYTLGVPALSQIAAQYDDTIANERMRPIPGMRGGTLIDLTQDIADNAGVMPASLTDRAGGGVHFARAGTLQVSAQYVRAWAA